MPRDNVFALLLDGQSAITDRTDPRAAWSGYVTEVLDHLRLPYQTRPDLGSAIDAHDLVVLPYAAAVDSGTLARVAEWVHAGGALMCVGDPDRLAPLLGVEVAGAVTHRHVRVHDAPVWTSAPGTDLHAVSGTRLLPDPDVTALATWTDDGSAAITVRRTGHGLAIACGVDLWHTIVRIQQGYPVGDDGAPAPDGSAPIDDATLKCEDGLALSFDKDRALPPGQPELAAGYPHAYPPASGLPMFHQPQADLWRSLFLQCVWWAAEHVALPVSWLHYWPSGIAAVAHMSHDADLNVDEQGKAALSAFDEAGVKVTWCQLFPGGYQPETYTAISAAGHEQALHYNAMHDADIARWGWPEVRAQYSWAQAVTGTEQIISNKNHYTRWEGFTEFYEWCERLGIQIDQSRGPSKQGTVGFPFGTAHVSFPMSGAEDRYRFYDVLNLPLHTQDLAWASHESVRDVILDGAADQHGVAHFLFHGAHLHRRPETRKACLALADEARRRGMPWWTSAEINRWERLRRTVELSVTRVSDGWEVCAHTPQPVEGAAILLSLPGLTTLPRLRSGEAQISTTVRHGRTFIELSTDIPAGTPARWILEETSSGS